MNRGKIISHKTAEKIRNVHFGIKKILSSSKKPVILAELWLT